MYRLAVCEDDDAIRGELDALCREILEEAGISYTVNLFPSAEELEKALSSQADPFDLLLLDIQMQGMTGMELAKALRLRGDRVSIIFITGCEDYLREGYSVQPVHFLLKPVSRQALAGALRTDWELNHKPKNIVLRIAGKTVSLPLSDIRYIESFNHSVVVHQADKTPSYPLSLTEVERLLPSGQFSRCHNSYLVNMEYVDEFVRRELFLRGGERLPMGRTYYKAFQSAFVRYMNR